MADESQVASYSLRVYITPRLADRLQALAGQLAVGERQLGAVCLALGFAALSAQVDMTVAPEASAEVLQELLAV